MRILIANLQRNVVGGVEKYLQHLIPNLLHRGHSLGLLYEYPFDPGKESIDPSATELPSWCTSDLGLKAALGALTRWEPDVVYSHGLDNSALEDALLDRYRVILYAHTYYGTCVSGTKCHVVPQVQPCSRQLGPKCLLLYYPRRCGGLDPRTMWRMFRHQSERKSRMARFRAILVGSHHMFAEFERHGVGPHQLRLLRLPHASVATQCPPLRKAPQGRLLFLGRLINLKGVHYLIRALLDAQAKLERPLTLTVAGDGPDREKLRSLASQLGLNVDFVGWVDTAQRVKLMCEADLLIMPSLWPEPFGLVGIEAGVLGLPSVGYAVGGIPDWLVPGESGELAPANPPSVVGLAEAIVRAIADPSHYSKLCHGAWQMSKNFTTESHLNALEPILGASTALACAT